MDHHCSGGGTRVRVAVASTIDRTEPIEQPLWHGIPPPLPLKFRDLQCPAAQRLCNEYERLRVECSNVSSELEAIYYAATARSTVQAPRVVSYWYADSEVESLMVTVPSARFVPSPDFRRSPTPPSPARSPAPPRRATRGTVHLPGPGYRAGSYSTQLLPFVCF